MADYIAAQQNLPLSTDVNLTVSLSQTVTQRSLQLACFIGPDLDVLPDESRFGVYSDVGSVGDMFGTDSEAYKAAQAFFGQSPNPSLMGVGAVFVDPQAARLVAGLALTAADIAALVAIQDYYGEEPTAYITIDGDVYALSPDFTGCTTQTQVAMAIDAALTAAGAPASCSVVTYAGGSSLIVITSTSTGDDATISFLSEKTDGPALALLQTTAGTGYSNDTGVATTGGNGTGCTVNITVGGGGAVAVVEIADGGDGYHVGDVLTIVQGGGSGATFTLSSVDCGLFFGTDARLTEATSGKALNGYTPTDLGAEMTNIQNAARAQSKFIYGWDLDVSFRVTGTEGTSGFDQLTAAAWALSQTYAIVTLVNNDDLVLAADPTHTTDIASALQGTLNNRAICIYHDNASYYPGMSILAYMLSVDYTQQDSVVNAKFKALPGIPSTGINSTQWSVIESKGFNCYTAMEGSVEVYREGTTASPSWWMDLTINIDNFVNYMQTAVYNVFLRGKKIAYTQTGVMQIYDAVKDVCDLFVFNGAFAARQVSDDLSKSGYTMDPAYTITFTPLYLIPQSTRVSRVGPPFTVTVMDSGGINKVTINVDVVA